MATDLVPKPWIINLAATYDGDEIRQPWQDVLVEGVVGINDYLVVPKGGTAANPDAGGGSRNQSVDILGLLGAAGWVLGDDTPNTQGIYRQRAGAVTINETLAANASGSLRIDLVVLEILEGSSKGRTRVVQGTPGAGVPATPNNCLPLASVSCANGFTVITSTEVTDLRRRAVGHVYEVFPAADVNGLGSTWQTLCTLPAFTLANDRSVRIEMMAKFIKTDASNSKVAIRVINTAQANVFVTGIGQQKIGATGGDSDEIVLGAAVTKPCLAGAYTLAMQSRRVNATINVLKQETVDSQVIPVTRLAAVLI